MKWLSNIKQKLHLLINKYKGYQLIGFRQVSQNQLIVCMNPENMKNGLADRLKGIISSYVLAVENNRVFKINHTAGFKLEDYLIPNELDWSIEEIDIAKEINHARVLHNFRYPLPRLKASVAQYHVSTIFDVLQDSSLPYNWTELFKKLFRPSPYLKALIDNKKIAILGDKYTEYIAIHTRFLNSLEINEESETSHVLPHNERIALICKVISTIENLCNLHKNTRMLIFSDSKSFLNSNFPKNCIPMIDNGNIPAHIGFNPNKATIDKAFLDLFIMSEAFLIYSIVGEHMYNSGYSQYAAKVSGNKFTRITYN